MDQLAIRTLTTQLAEDLGWLENHCRAQPEQAAQAGQLRLAAALVRNCLGPFLDGQPRTPLHIAVVGGAGSGKSTVANLLSGALAAEANPQAGFTRHPVAYTSTNGPTSWSGHLGFLGPLQRLAEAGPASLDADVYQVRRVPDDPTTFSLLKDCVIWDCPDMTTWAATGYVPRLLEVSGLADVLVYVASDERYNDEVPTQFLRLLLETGKPVVVCLTKMRPAEAPALLAHFQKEVLAGLPAGVVGTLTVPHLTPAQLADPFRQAPQYRIPLLNQVVVLLRPAERARRRAVQGAAWYLQAMQERLTGSARKDVAALESWRAVVQAGQAEFEGRYRREYLHSEKFRRFDEALVRLMELLELPGVGQVVSKTLWVLRTPYRLVRDFVSKALARPDAPPVPEQPVLEASLDAWLDLLRKEAARHGETHPLWQHISDGFAGNLAESARERFRQGLRAFQLGQADEVDRTARAIYEHLEKNPALLNTLRGGKFALEVASLTGALITAGTHLWVDAIIAFVVPSLTQQLVEWFGKAYVENQRELARQRQQALLSQHIATPLAEWLIQWPATGGSTYERLQLALRRIPPAVVQLSAAVSEDLGT
jgi:energy-coupling factor transporter ATP-binding protein EcfA2